MDYEPSKRSYKSILSRKKQSPRRFCEKGVLRNFAKFTGKHLFQNIYFNKVTGLACNFIKNDSLAQVFVREFCETSKSTFFYRTDHVAVSVSFRLFLRYFTGYDSRAALLRCIIMLTAACSSFHQFNHLYIQSTW